MNSQEQRKRDEEAELPRERYFNDGYFDVKQLASLSQQIVELKNLSPKSVLEIGVGNGFVSGFMQKAGYQMTTFDINPALEPHVVGNICDLEKTFGADAFDSILCAEVLEHLPFDQFSGLLQQLHSVCRSGCIITLPRCDAAWIDFRFALKLPRFDRVELNIQIPRPNAKKTIYAGHHWEINSSKETSLVRIRSAMKAYFSSVVDYRFMGNLYHQFFILRV